MVQSGGDDLPAVGGDGCGHDADGSARVGAEGDVDLVVHQLDGLAAVGALAGDLELRKVLQVLTDDRSGGRFVVDDQSLHHGGEGRA